MFGTSIRQQAMGNIVGDVGEWQKEDGEKSKDPISSVKL
jgi:hypothetical protein